MTKYELPSLPNFEITVGVSGVKLYISFFGFRGNTFFDIKDAYGDLEICGMRAIDRQWLIPYGAYVPEGIGNFRLEDDAYEYPDYNYFGKRCRLVYYTKEEVDALEKGHS